MILDVFTTIFLLEMFPKTTYETNPLLNYIPNFYIGLIISHIIALLFIYIIYKKHLKDKNEKSKLYLNRFVSIVTSIYFLIILNNFFQIIFNISVYSYIYFFY